MNKTMKKQDEKSLAAMSKEERSLVLFFETRAVDHGGKVSGVHMNADDFDIVESWNKNGFVLFGRLASEHVTQSGGHWCSLSDDAWRLAHEERRARAKRMWSARSWITTEEKRSR